MQHLFACGPRSRIACQQAPFYKTQNLNQLAVLASILQAKALVTGNIFGPFLES